MKRLGRCTPFDASTALLLMSGCSAPDPPEPKAGAIDERKRQELAADPRDKVSLEMRLVLEAVDGIRPSGG